MGPGDPKDTTRLEAAVRGRVQGVGFRFFVIEAAEDLGLVGWVANDRDGSLRCVAEGPRQTVERFLERLRTGPPAARVDDVRAAWSEPTGEFSNFGVRFGGHPG